MKYFSVLLLMFSQFPSFKAWAEIHEVKSMKEVQNHVTPDSVVVFDLDNTVLEAKQMLGSDQFFGFLVKRAEEAGLQGKDPKKLASLQATNIQPVSEVQFVEEMTLDWVKQLQRQKIKVIALTARPPAWAKETLKQVASLGLDFQQTAPSLPSQTREIGSGAHYEKGVIFLPSGFEKGKALKEFLKRTHLKPVKIIFLDDKLYNVESVDSAMLANGVESQAFRYGAADEKVNSFDPRVANFQYHYFLLHQVFLSDEETERKLAHVD
jgi:FMN phosphatase YigB (HAD superfamily)